jgi:hypothetical protein
MSPTVAQCPLAPISSESRKVSQSPSDRTKGTFVGVEYFNPARARTIEKEKNMKLGTLKVLLESPAVQPTDRGAALRELQEMANRGESEAKALLDTIDERREFPPIVQEFLKSVGKATPAETTISEEIEFRRSRNLTVDEEVAVSVARGADPIEARGLIELLRMKYE